MAYCYKSGTLGNMDLTSPLRSLIPSLDSAVLEVLARTESGLSVSRIARLAPRGSRQGLSLAIERMVEHGLVMAEPANQGFLYRLNRDHVLTSALLLALNSRRTVIEEIKGAVERLQPEPVHAALFGSFARADGGPESDIDLFILTTADVDLQGDAWQGQLRDLESHVLSWTGNRMEALVLSADTWADAIHSEEPIVNSLLEESIPLLGDPLRDLTAEVADPEVRR